MKSTGINTRIRAIKPSTLIVTGAALCLVGVAVVRSPESLTDGLASLAQQADYGETSPLCYNGRVAPTLFVVGCQKCGTTSLWEDAIDHIYGLTTGLYKEHHYWHDGDTRYVDASLDNYVLSYPGCNDLNEPRLKADKIIGADFDPQMSYEDVPGSIKTAYGNAFGEGVWNKLNFVSILRDPVNRTLSYFYHALDEGWLDVTDCDDCCDSWWISSSCNCSAWGYQNKYCCTEKLTFEQRMATCNTTFDHWVDVQLDRADACVKKGTQLWPDCGDAGLFASLYVYQIENFLSYFHANQFSIIPFDLYINDADTAVAALANISGNAYEKMTFTAEDVNTASEQGRAYTDMLPETHQKLVAFFEPYNQLLYDYVDKMDLRIVGGDTTNFLHTATGYR